MSHDEKNQNSNNNNNCLLLRRLSASTTPSTTNSSRPSLKRKSSWKVTSRGLYPELLIYTIPLKTNIGTSPPLHFHPVSSSAVYSCALLRDILLQGRLYISRNWLCFYANLFGKDIKVSGPTDRPPFSSPLSNSLSSDPIQPISILRGWSYIQGVIVQKNLHLICQDETFIWILVFKKKKNALNSWESFWILVSSALCNHIKNVAVALFHIMPL